MILVLLNSKARFALRTGVESLTADIRCVLGMYGEVRTCSSLDELKITLACVNPDSLSALVPFGGDGTVSTVLSHAIEIWGEERLPPILTVFAGTMNEIAGDVHAKRRTPLESIGLLASALKNGEAPLLSKRYPMCVNKGRLGFALGFGASSRFLDQYYAKGAGIWQACKLVAACVGSALMGGSLIKRLFAPMTGQATVDCRDIQVHWNFFLALTVRHLPLGVRLSTSGGQSAEPNLCMVAGKASLFRLALALPFIWLGRLPASTGLHRQEAKELRFQFDEPQAWHLDGDLFPAEKSLSVSIGPALLMIQHP